MTVERDPRGSRLKGRPLFTPPSTPAFPPGVAQALIQGGNSLPEDLVVSETFLLLTLLSMPKWMLEDTFWFDGKVCVGLLCRQGSRS